MKSFLSIYWIASLPIVLLLWESVSHHFDGFDAKNIEGKRVIVCGASTGIGEQMAYKYCSFGAHVAILSRRREKLNTVAEKCRGLGAASVTIIVGDVSTVENSKRVLQEALESEGFGGEMDVLVLNHVIGIWGWWLPDDGMAGSALLDGPNGKAKGVSGGFSFVEKIFRVNTFSYIYLSTMAMPVLEKSHGRIIVVSSGAGEQGLPKVAAYSATKHALHGFFDSLRIELKHKSIPVSISLGVIGNIDTEANRTNTGNDLKLIQRASKEECALAIIRAGEARERQFYHPKAQGIHIMPKVRPWMMDVMDTILLKIAI